MSSPAKNQDPREPGAASVFQHPCASPFGIQGRAADLQAPSGTTWRPSLAGTNWRFPKEIILLGGAPGAGKGTNTPFITEARGLTCEPVVISALLDTPEAKRLKDGGNMVGDREVIGLLLRRLLLAGVPRRRYPRRLSPHQGAGRVPKDACRENARSLRREFYAPR